MITVKSKGRRGLSSAALFKVAQDGLLPRFHKSVEVVPFQYIPMPQLGIRYAAQLTKPLHKLMRTSHILRRLLQAEPRVRHDALFRWFFISVSIHWPPISHAQTLSILNSGDCRQYGQPFSSHGGSLCLPLSSHPPDV